MPHRAPFPVLYDWQDQALKYLLPAVPFWVVEEHRKQACENHRQTLERLAERGGLAPCELCAVLENRPWERMDTRVAIERVRTIVEKRTAGHRVAKG